MPEAPRTRENMMGHADAAYSGAGARGRIGQTLTVVAALTLPWGCTSAPSAPDEGGPDTSTPAAAVVPNGAPGGQSTAGGVVLDPRAPSPSRLLEILAGAERTEVVPGIAHYRFEVPLGPGAFDVVRLHRIVRERRPHRPVRTAGSLFMTHGSSLSFEAIFLDAGTEDPDEETSPAVHLAAGDVDVWGMDFAWGLVPEETESFDFMRDWGVERDVDHTVAAMSIARWIRALDAQGPGAMHLLGYSYGAAVAYAAAGRETQQRPVERDVAGIVPVDLALKFESSEAAEPFAPCQLAAGGRSRLDSGQYHDAAGVRFAGISGLATSAPHEPSPLLPIPGITNLQAALFVGANTFQTGPREFWHFVAGDLNEEGIPVGLLYSDVDRWLRLGASLPPYMPVRANYEVGAAGCPDAEDVTLDDHLPEIRVPILYLGAAGGFGTSGDFTASLTRSEDITLHTVSLQPADRRTVDFGHADLMLADDADELVWSVLRDWLVERGGPAAERGGGPPAGRGARHLDPHWQP